MISTARETLYGKLQAKGWEKRFTKATVEEVTKVEVGSDGAKVSYINPDGSAKAFVEKNGDQRPYTDNDLINDLTNDIQFSKLVPAKGNTGNGGQQNYNNSNANSNVKVISNTEVGSNLENIISGKVQRAE